MPVEMELDMRGREPPEPLFETLDCVDMAKPGDVVRLRIHHEPLMLYPYLQCQRIPWVVESCGAPDWVIRIGPMPPEHS